MAEGGPFLGVQLGEGALLGGTHGVERVLRVPGAVDLTADGPVDVGLGVPLRGLGLLVELVQLLAPTFLVVPGEQRVERRADLPDQRLLLAGGDGTGQLVDVTAAQVGLRAGGGVGHRSTPRVM